MSGGMRVCALLFLTMIAIARVDDTPLNLALPAFCLRLSDDFTAHIVDC